MGFFNMTDLASYENTANKNSVAQPNPIKITPIDLYWLAEAEDWTIQVKALDDTSDPGEAWARLVRLANLRLDLVRINRLDKTLQRRYTLESPPKIELKPMRLALLSSSTIAHLVPAIRVAALRRGIFITCYQGEYGQYTTELADNDSGLHRFKPDVILLALDAYHVTRGLNFSCDAIAASVELENTLANLKRCWRLAREAGVPLIQQSVLPVFVPIFGSNEHRIPGSKHQMVARVNEALRTVADEEGIDLLSVDAAAAMSGVVNWHNPVYWFRAKQEVNPAASPLYGDLLLRILAARQGRSFKCLVLDLDNTLWGGVIGDDGLDGIVLGQGSAHGEAFLDLQAYALQLSKRGVILAVCSKNDEANAISPFEKHPDMILKRSDIACFVANWNDKATNIRRIASELNIGLDSLVFVDDNPFERNLVREELPMVAVPEMPLDPALYARTLADAGYFEGVALTDDDRDRTRQYRLNAERAALQAETTDLPSYLKSLQMELVWKKFDAIGLQRTTQLINKTNQFNLTTRRYTEEDVRGVIDCPRTFGLQMRLKDRFGDNGIIAIVIARKQGGDALIDTWLMSCRVLGRQVEYATLALVIDAAKALGAERLIGEFIPTAKNVMVKDHYSKLGFELIDRLDGGSTRWSLDLSKLLLLEFYMTLKQG